MTISVNQGKCSSFTRRRVLKIAATFGAGGLLSTSPLFSHAMAAEHKITWKGVALGAEAEFQIMHHSKQDAQQALNAAVAELRRLETLFNLYNPASLVSKLNQTGQVERPSVDFLSLLSLADSLSTATLGGFDITVQPLWQTESTAATIGYKHLQIGADTIAFTKADMAVTLNGIAQGYITDRITEVLRDAGLKHVLVNAGEIRSTGETGPNQPWRVAVLHDGQSYVDLRDQALAVSSAYTSSTKGKRPHLFNPRTGQAVTDFKTIIVKAPNAALADALSTGLSVLPVEEWDQVLQNLDGLPLTVKAIYQDGRRIVKTT